MKASCRWLQDLAPDLEATPQELAERSAMLGFPVEGLHFLSEGLTEVVVANVVSVRPHPNADRLRLCQVDGGGGELQVVCGADNVTAGGWYPFAPIGATLPGGTRIGEASLRGERSQGMLCSERELGLGSGKDGLMELSGPFKPGSSFVQAVGLDDVRMDVEVTANRGDLLSHEGLARELAPKGHAGLRLPRFPGEAGRSEKALAALDLVTDAKAASGDGIVVRIEAPELCSRYLGLVVRGVRVAPSPPWLQARLRAAGARPVNNVVDATNYVLLELGQPLHAFDLSLIKDRTIVVRTARAGEGLRTLDGEGRQLAPSMLAICDAEAPIAVAGVMGGAGSEVTSSTTDVLLECALFKPGSIRATRKALGLSTDASYRFERGVDPEGMVRALLRAARLVLATAGGTIRGPVVDCCPGPFSRNRIRLRRERVERVLGVPFGRVALRRLLVPLGFVVRSGAAGSLDVEVPGWRSYDVTREVDLIEEIARLHGYEQFPEEARPFRPGTVPDHPLFRLEDEVRDELVGWGFLEAQTPAFAPEGEGEVELLNPVSAEERFLRRRLLTGLLRRLEHNAARGNRDVRLFEIGTVFRSGDAGELPRESVHLALVMHGRRSPPHWSAKDVHIDLWDLKGVVERIRGLLAAEDWAISAAPAFPGGPPGHEWASIQVADGSGKPVGLAGRIPKERVDLPPWAGDVWAAEIALPANPRARPAREYEPLPMHPGVERDLALLVPGRVEVDGILGTARAAAGPYVAEVGVFDVYRDEKMPPGQRSVAVRLKFRATDRTLTDEEVDQAMRAVVESLQEKLSVGVRGQAP